MSEHIVGVNPKEYNGKKYRSTLEARTAETLDKLGLPWEYETKKITLQEGFYCPYQTKKVREIAYIPDFIVGPILLETKGYETPDWSIKKKLLYRHLTIDAPGTPFYMVKNDKQLLEALDKHWVELGFAVRVSPKPKKEGQEGLSVLYNSIKEAMEKLNLQNKSIGGILRSLKGEKQWVYNYNWQIIKIKL